jgi:signal transduction histidine kinase/CheY-like chemotaxis protein
LLSIFAGTGYVRASIEKYIETDMLVVADIADRFISSEIEMLKYEAEDIADKLLQSSSSNPSMSPNSSVSESATSSSATSTSSTSSPPPSADTSRVTTGTLNTANWQATLKEEIEHYTEFIGMAVIDRSGNIITSIGESPVPETIIENEYIQKAFSGKTAFTSTVPTEDGVALYLATPLNNTSEMILVLTLDGLFFSDLASEYQVWETGHIFIDDKEGYIIANIRHEWVQNRQNFIVQAQNEPGYEDLASVIKKVVAGDRGVDYYSLNGISRICAYTAISSSEEGWCLGIVAPLSESPVRNVDTGLIIVAVIGFLLNIIAAIVASNFIKKPFEEVAALREAAEESSRAKTSFLAHMSHEMRTPLNAVMGLSELALTDKKLTEETEDKLEKIHASGTTLLSIINDILDISKIESGKFEVLPTKYDTPSMINDVVTLNAVRVGERPVNFKILVDEKLPAVLYGDDLRVKQIFNNLLSNAFKYTEEGLVTWQVGFEREGDSIWLVSSITDTGIGIKPENIDGLFTDYYQVDRSANRKIEGTGLGLPITKLLVEMMEGSITIQSEYGQGTTVRVRLKQKFISDTPIGKTVAESLMNMKYLLAKHISSTKLVRNNMSYAAVLVVDDIATNIDVVKGMLKPYKMRIDCAMSGQQAIEMVKAADPRYDAVFMDHMMPGMDGIEATRIIREEIGTDYAANIPIIALTANAILGNEEMFLSKGFQAFISKPIDMIKLDTVLNTWVRNSELEKELSNTPTDEDTSDAPEQVGEEAKGILMAGEIVGIDKEKALKRFSGDAAVLMEVLRSYSENTPPLLDDLELYLKEERLADYAIAVHGVKGSSYGVCADEIGKLAEALENAAKVEDLSAVRSEHEHFVGEVKVLLASIKDMLADLDAASQKPPAASPDPKHLQELRDACRAFDIGRVNAVMTRLESFDYENGAFLIKWLREKVSDMEFEEISDGEWPSQ